MSIRYGQKISTLPSRKSSFFKKNRFDRSTIRKPRGGIGGWVRPADWLAMPTITSTEQKIALLVPVFEQGSNFLAFLISGAYTVNWGDGVTENFSAGVKAQHQYTYTDPDLNASVTSDGYKMAIVIITPQTGHNLTSVNFNQAYTFADSTSVNAILVLEIIFSCPNLGATGSLIWGPLGRTLVHFSGINTGLLNSYSNLFSGFSSLKRISFSNASAVTDMSNMFNGQCRSLMSVSISNTSAVTNTSNMFKNCPSLASVPLFDTSRVTNISGMFQGCTALTSVPLLDTRKVTDMTSMFQGCTALTRAPMFYTGTEVAIMNMTSMFSGCSSLTVVSISFSNNLTTPNMTSMFQGCTALVSAFVSLSADGSTMANMTSLFQGCSSLTDVFLGNTGSVTGAWRMFSGCTSLTSVPLFDLSSSGTVAYMFENCTSLSSVPLFNLTSCVVTGYMFSGCTSLTSVPLLDTRKVTYTTGMFQGCTALTSVPLFDLSSNTSMFNMFNTCTSLTSVPLFDTRKVIDMGGMFAACTALTSVPLIDASLVPDQSVYASSLGEIFVGCSSLSRGALKGVRESISYAGCKLSKEELEYVFTNLGVPFSSLDDTITITGNWGVAPPIILETQDGAIDAGSPVILMQSTAGLQVGMEVTGFGSPISSSYSPATDYTLDQFIIPGMQIGDEIWFVTAPTGLARGIPYYLVAGTVSGRYRVASSPGGAALPFSNNGVGVYIKYRTEIVSVSSTSITLSRPMISDAGFYTSHALTFQHLKTSIALLKSWTVIS